jgi:hypothetical protein
MVPDLYDVSRRLYPVCVNFHQARLKIKRADHHIDKLEARIMALYGTDHSNVKVDPKNGEETLIHDFSDPAFFEDAALILGDAIHNLKCALDYTWLETITRMAPTLVDDRAKFPARKVDELKGWMESKGARVHTVSPALYRFMLDVIAAHTGWEWAILPLHRMNNRDKHRLLLPVLSQVHIKGIELEDENGERHIGSGVSAELQKPPYCIRYRRGLHVINKGELTALIMIEDTDSGDRLPVLEAASMYSHNVSRVVKLFEAFLEMEGY